jgi:hypothetical protein
MDFLTTIVQTIAFVLTPVNEIEGLFSHRAGSEKKDAAVPLSDLFAPILQRLLYEGHKLIRNRTVD